MTDRARLIARARALWSRTATDFPEEAATAGRLLDAFLAKHGLSMEELGPIPYPNARPLPEREYTPSFAEINRRRFYTAANDSHWRVPTGHATPNWPGWTTRTIFEDVPTIEPIDRSRFGDRLDTAPHSYNIHWWREWGLFACVGHPPGTDHTFLGFYGQKWRDLLIRYQTVPSPPNWLDDLHSRLRVSVYKVRDFPYPSVTELAGENEWEWIELEENDLRLLYHFQQDALLTLLQGIVQASRQYETAHQRDR